VGIAAALVAGVAVALAARAGRPRDERLVLADLRQPATSLALVALATGCFAREGIAVEERSFELGRDALVALSRKEVDAAVAFDAPVLRAYAGDGSLRVLSMLHTSTRNTRLVARADRGIRGFGDLRGKRVGAARGTNADFFLDTVLTFAGLSRADVTVVDLSPERAPAALASGEVDAVALSDPHAERARAVAGGHAVEVTSELYAEFSLLVTRADVVASRRAALEALLRGLACGERVLVERPGDALAAIRGRFPERTEEELRAALGRVSPGLGLDGRVVAVLRREADWLAAGHGVGAAPDPSAMLDPSLLDRVEPDAVNLAFHR
jgi:NitT/TauT family transport system substrate-binding protein